MGIDICIDYILPRSTIILMLPGYLLLISLIKAIKRVGTACKTFLFPKYIVR